MSITVEKAKLASERFLLVRLNPARFILPSSIGSGKYEITMPFLINKIENNGTALTKVSSIPTNDGEWYQDETTLTVTVKLASAPNDSDNILIAFYYLFYTGTKFRSWHEDPEDTGTSLRDWQPKISNYPSILNSFDNIINGVFTISSSTLDLINENSQFQEYLSEDDSFFNKEVKIWLCITDETNIINIFNGSIVSMNCTSNKVSISIVDDFVKLKQPCLMGDPKRIAYYDSDLYGVGNLDPRAEGLPVPYIWGDYSRYLTGNHGSFVAGAPNFYSITDGTEAFCTNISADITSNNNRSWTCCRQKFAYGGGTAIGGTFTAVTSPVSGIYFVNASILGTANLVGDTIRWLNASVVKYGRILHIGSFTYSAVNYNLVIETSDAIAVSDVIQQASNKSFAIVIKRSDNSYYYPLNGRDYIVNQSIPAGGFNYVTAISFFSTMEASLSMVGALDPKTDTVLFRTSQFGGDNYHASALIEILERAGLTTDWLTGTTFADTITALANDALFHIPNFDETDFDSYLKYVQDILASTLGYIKLNQANEVEYYLLDAPTSTDERSSFNMIDGSTGMSLDYQDIATTLIAYNPHNSSVQAIYEANTPSVTSSNDKARYLHGVVNVNRFRHVLKTIENRMDAHIGLKSNRKVIYSFETATDDIDTDLGDDLQLNNKIVLGSSDIQDVKVISIDKSPSTTRIEASDLKGL